ncbi:hypothetical protein COS70_01290 [Candidatus Micrarchaeota archaeon CG06_land_8_20_14_3_00_50_6]|nr:MAG: hypothetical protein COS70_01290 [Candidatus Micrarchaeota archaeon CG06_land_8_20_14_3_00_50_6]
MKKNYLPLLLLVFALALFAFAMGGCTTTGPTEANINKLANPVTSPGFSLWFGNWQTLVILLSMTTILLLALAYGIAIAFNLKHLRVWADHEIVQVVATVIILASFFAMLSLFDTLVNEMVLQCLTTSVDCSFSESLDCTAGESCSVIFAEQYIGDLKEVAHNTGQNFLANAKYFGEVSMQRNGKFSQLMYTGFYGYITQPNAGLSLLLERNNQLLDMTTQLMGALDAQRYFVGFAGNILGPGMILLGTILRSFFFTRRTGGLLLAIGFGLVLVWPTMYVFSWLTLNIAVFGDQAVASSGCPVECKPMSPAAIDRANAASACNNPAYVKCCNALTAFTDPDCAVTTGNKVLFSTADLSSLPLARKTAANMAYCSNITLSNGIEIEGVCEYCPIECRTIPFPASNPLCVESECAKCPDICKIKRIRTDNDLNCNSLNCPNYCRAYQANPESVSPKGWSTFSGLSYPVVSYPTAAGGPATYATPSDSCSGCLGANHKSLVIDLAQDPDHDGIADSESGAFADCPSFCRVASIDENGQVVIGPQPGDPNYAVCQEYMGGPGSTSASCSQSSCPLICRTLVPHVDSGLCGDPAMCGNCPVYCRFASGYPSKPECTAAACTTCRISYPECLVALPGELDCPSTSGVTCYNCPSNCRVASGMQVPQSGSDFIADTEWIDTNGNGVQDPGETQPAYVPKQPFRGPCSLDVVAYDGSAIDSPCAAGDCDSGCKSSSTPPVCRAYGSADIFAGMSHPDSFGHCVNCPTACRYDIGTEINIYNSITGATYTVPSISGNPFTACQGITECKSTPTNYCGDECKPDIAAVTITISGTCKSYDPAATGGTACEQCPYLDRFMINGAAPTGQGITYPSGCSNLNCPATCKVELASGGSPLACEWYQGLNSAMPGYDTGKTYIEQDITLITTPRDQCRQCPLECRFDGVSASGCTAPAYACGTADCPVECHMPFTVPQPVPAACYQEGSSVVNNCNGCPSYCRIMGVSYPAGLCPDKCFDLMLCPNNCKAYQPASPCDNCRECPTDLMKPLQCNPAAAAGSPKSAVYSCPSEFTRGDCADWCVSQSTGTKALSPADYIRSGGGSGLFGAPDTAAVGLLYIPAYVLPLLNIVLTLSFIRVFSMFLGGDIEIPGLSRIL